MRTLTWLLLCLPTFAVANQHDLQHLIEGNHAAVGSREHIDGLSYQLHIKEPSFELTGIYTVTRSGKMRIDIYMQEERVFTEALNGTKAWQWNAGDEEPTFVNKQAAAALWHGTQLPGHINTLKDLESNGHKVSLVKHTDNNPTIKVTLSDGHEKYYELDPETFHIIRGRDHRAFHPDIDSTEVMIESRYSNFRKVEGIAKNFTQINWDLTNNTLLGKTDVLCLQINPAIAPKLFEIDSFNQSLPPPTCGNTLDKFKGQ